MKLVINPVAIIRFGVVGAVIVVVSFAAASFAVESGRISSFGRAGRAITRAAAPAIEPIKRRMAAETMGPREQQRSPAFWLGVTAVVAGALAVSALEWMLIPQRAETKAGTLDRLKRVRLGLTYAFAALMALTLAGLLGSLLGAAPTGWWMRPFALGTGWLVRALTGSVPRLALLNVSALMAYLALRVARWYAMRVV